MGRCVRKCAFLLQGVGDTSLAHQCFRLALVNNNHHAEAYNNLAVLEMRKGHVEQVGALPCTVDRLLSPKKSCPGSTSAGCNLTGSLGLNPSLSCVSDVTWHESRVSETASGLSGQTCSPSLPCLREMLYLLKPESWGHPGNLLFGLPLLPPHVPSMVDKLLSGRPPSLVPNPATFLPPHPLPPPAWTNTRVSLLVFLFSSQQVSVPSKTSSSGQPQGF